MRIELAHGSDIQAAIDSLPACACVTYTDRLAGTHEIVLESTGAAWDVPTSLVIPGNKAVVIRSAAPWGTWLRYTGSGDRILTISAGWRYVELAGMYITGRGVAVDGACRRRTRFDHVVFQDVAGPAIFTTGQSVIGVEVDDCWFNYCGGGVWINHPNSDMISIRRCLFNRNTDVDVYANSSGVDVLECWFENRSSGAAVGLDKPFIHLPYGLCKVSRCSFGADVQVPQYAITCGPLTRSAGTIIGLSITDNMFYGLNPYGATATPYPDDTRAKAPLHFTKTPYQCRVTGNQFRRYASGLVHLDYNAGGYAAQSVWAGNSNWDWGVTPVPVFFGESSAAWRRDDV